MTEPIGSAIRSAMPSAPTAPGASAAWPDALPGPVGSPTVWRVDVALDDESRRRCRTLLCATERARADRFLREQDRDRYLASHAALRIVLATALDDRATELTFAANAHGKPELSGPWRGRLEFNLSHSGAIALIAIAPDARVGVDVEIMRPLSDCLAIARGHFASDEVAALAGLPPDRRMEAFFACWTRKEAFVKALGLGLSMALDRFSVSIPPSPSCLVSIDGEAEAARAWRLEPLEPGPRHVGTLAIDARAGACRTVSLPPDWTELMA